MTCQEVSVIYRKALQLLEHICRTVPQRIPSKRLLPLVVKTAFDGPSEVREAALLLLSRLAQEKEVFDTLRRVSNFHRVPSLKAECVMIVNVAVCVTIACISNRKNN